MFYTVTGGELMLLIPLPDYGFDPTEAAIPWKFFSQKKEKIVFSTPTGKIASGDQRLLTGKGFGLLKKALMAQPSAISAYHEMILSEEFKHPISYQDIIQENFNGLLLPGGHDPGMKSYLASTILQNKVAEFFAAQKPIGAICHGTIVAARTTDQQTKQSVLYNYETTSLLKSQEMLAYGLTFLWLKNYYRTYPTPVQVEVTNVLKNSKQFHTGPLPLFRDSETNEKHAFVVEDRNYISARWPGDAHLFAKTFYSMYLAYAENEKN